MLCGFQVIKVYNSYLSDKYYLYFLFKILPIFALNQNHGYQYKRLEVNYFGRSGGT